MGLFSTESEMRQIAEYIRSYVRIPFFDSDAISGKAVEKIIGIVKGGEVLNTYDYVDVVRRGETGWQVKSTKAGTPLTWKRAKIANSEKLIGASTTDAGLAALGKAILDFCNDHAKESIETYDLDEIGYCRLIVNPDNSVHYFERALCTRQNPSIFNPDEFTWNWSAPKKTRAKEQLSALHGYGPGGTKDFAWHGKGENQLHFSGESSWWPELKKPTNTKDILFSEDGHAISFLLPAEKVEWKDLLDFLKAS